MVPTLKPQGCTAERLSAVEGAFRLGPLSLSLAPGTTTLVTGRSQAGKSALLKTLAGFGRGASGRLQFGEVSVELPGSPEAWRALHAGFGFVFQQDALFDDRTALENVAAPLLLRHTPREEATARAQTTLDRVGLGDAAMKLPRELSGGMRKRLGIARALVARPSLLLVDEPLAGLDPASVGRITDLLEAAAAEGATLLIAAADGAPFARVATQQLHLEHGGLVT